MAQPELGILTLYLNDNKVLEEKSVYEKMIAAGARMGLSIFVFTPADVDDNGRVNALFYRTKSRAWYRRKVRLPQMIYDRCRIQRSKRFEQLLEFRKKYAHLLFLNRPLRNKWTIYRTLGKVSSFRAHLPATRLYSGPEDVQSMLSRYSLLYLKPINGTGGRGILRIEKLKNGTLLLQGRNHSRRIVQPKRIYREHLSGELRSWDMRGDRYIVQQGLHIRLPNGRVHDYRLLVQKNGLGEWEVTGCAGRVGPPRSITSNLHGGGTAAPMNSLLRQWVGSESKIAQIRQTAERLGIAVAKHLEANIGALCELALDLAIDRSGRVWLLEVNPKPAREVFIRAGERDVYRKALTRPLEYAMWLYRAKRSGRSGLADQRTQGAQGTQGTQGVQRTQGTQGQGAESGRSGMLLPPALLQEHRGTPLPD
ncbi:YheC/YheD family protein [Cohnella lubricantis]|uniref:YheC/YheD family protein n=1 Tax=Cohnella lubricantis TaxID=2163172 RepID=A0A841TE03_9BACL|nr:YheC/YheD family protein [Cohnella lubricantis]MBB6677558.1 YheC/YheD family protein [Cohnella lubricantis]MBP2116556.1 glutathione synthase/RimK-type ligase-like ATP-grasp enzyme [Cohnella lubricantis]